MTVKNNDIYVGPEKSFKNYKRRNFTLVNKMACNFDTILNKNNARNKPYLEINFKKNVFCFQNISSY